MRSDLSTIMTFDLKQMVTLINAQLEQIRQTAQTGMPPASYSLQQGLAQLSNQMQRLTNQVNQLEDDHNNLVALAEIGQVVNSTLELSQVLQVVMDTIIRLTEAERGFLMLREGGSAKGKLTMRVARNWEKVSLDSSEFAISQTVIERVASGGESVVTTNAQEDPRFGGQESIIAYNLRSILCVPLKVKNDITGVIYTDNRIRTGIFTEAKRTLLSAFANQAAVAIENARLFESVRRTLDEVTRLKNLMDNVFASIASGVITADVQDRILMCNKAAEGILGWAPTQMIGHSLNEILPPISAELPGRVAGVRQQNEPVVGLEYASDLAHRGPVVLSMNMAPLKDSANATQGVAIVMEDLTERKRLEAQYRLFERMVSPAVIGMLDPDKLQLGGRRTQITTLFADVRGFTSFGEKHDPEQLVSILNRYLSVAAGAILDQQGTIDKFLGDAIMAWFNAPIPQPDHMVRAVKAALKMVKAIRTLHEELPPEFHLSFGVGIHYGDAVLGLVGNEMRLDYTAIGDSVNTAKRIQEHSAGGQILISEQVYRQLVDRLIVRPVDPIIAKGKSQPLSVYELLRVL